MENYEIRKKAKDSGVKLWEVAEKYGLSDCNFSKKLRRELNEQERQKIFSIIEMIASEKAVENE